MQKLGEKLINGTFGKQTRKEGKQKKKELFLFVHKPTWNTKKSTLTSEM